jgi:hypothetical protein
MTDIILPWFSPHAPLGQRNLPANLVAILVLLPKCNNPKDHIGTTTYSIVI